MPNLHKYVPSSEKTGYYIVDYFNGKHVTYQVTTLANQLLEKLDYGNGDAIASEVFYTLHRFNLIYTNSSGVEPPSSLKDIPELIEAESPDVADRNQFFSLLIEEGEFDAREKKDLEQYLEDADLDPNPDDSPQDQLASNHWRPDNPGPSEVYRGTVEFFNDIGGYGFIDCKSLEEDVFYHMEDIGGRDIQEGTELEFVKKEAEKGPRATHVRPPSEETPDVNKIDNGSTNVANRPPLEEFQKAREYETSFDVILLGTGTKWSTKDRSLRSILVERGSKRYLFDAGEGTQRRMRENDIEIDIDSVFLTSPEVDCLGGLGPLLSTMSHQGRKSDVKVYSPPSSVDRVKAILEIFDSLTFSVDILPIADEEMINHGEITVHGFRIGKNGQWGFALEEAPRSGGINRKRAEELGLSVGDDAYSELVAGDGQRTLSNGAIVDAREVLLDPIPGRSLVYLTAIDDGSKLTPYVRKSDLVIYGGVYSIEKSDHKDGLTEENLFAIDGINRESKVVFSNFSPEIQTKIEALKEKIESTFGGDFRIASDGDGASLAFPQSKPNSTETRKPTWGDPVTDSVIKEGMWISLNVDRSKGTAKALSKNGSVHIRNGADFVGEEVIVKVVSKEPGYVVAVVRKPPEGAVICPYSPKMGNASSHSSYNIKMKQKKSKKKKKRAAGKSNPFKGSSEAMRDLVRKKY